MFSFKIPKRVFLRSLSPRVRQLWCCKDTKCFWNNSEISLRQLFLGECLTFRKVVLPLHRNRKLQTTWSFSSQKGKTAGIVLPFVFSENLPFQSHSKFESSQVAENSKSKCAMRLLSLFRSIASKSSILMPPIVTVSAARALATIL